MRTDQYGQVIFSESDLCGLYMEDASRSIKNAFVDTNIPFSDDLELSNTPTLIEYVNSVETMREFDARLQSNWHMPQEYKDLDIVSYVLDKCQTDAQLQRVGAELLLYQARNLFPLLQYLVYLVDTMRENKIVWGVGRGSSVASYVLYLLGVHRVDSMYYDLEIKEFLR